jgi:hypothetical protein
MRSTWRGFDHGGAFSLDASVRIEGGDCAGLERLLRYCARSPFALELDQVHAEQLVYCLPRPQPDGAMQLRLTPLGDREGTRASPVLTSI